MRPIVGLLHASPLKNNFSSSVSSSITGGEEIPDIEVELERQEIQAALQASKRHCVLMSQPLTKPALVEALKRCHILLLGAHGIAGGGIVLETNWFQGELLTVSELTEILVKLKNEGELVCKFCFVSSCYSELAGRALMANGVEHVVTIAGEDRISNLVSRSFFSRVLLALLLDLNSVGHAVESGLKFVETHPELTPARRMRQREKFVYYCSEGRAGELLFDSPIDNGLVEQAGLANSTLVGFPSSTLQQPGPIFGRQETIQDVLQALLLNGKDNHGLVVLRQAAKGMGSSLIVHFVASYLATRRAFDTIELVHSFAVASSRLLLTNSPGSLLLVVDAALDDDEGEKEFWQAVEVKPAISLLVVSKSNTAIPLHVTPLFVEPLKPKYVVMLLDYLAKGETPPTIAFGKMTLTTTTESIEGNPLQVIAKAKTNKLTTTTNQSITHLIQHIQQDLAPVWRASVMATTTMARTLTATELAFIDRQRNRFASQEQFWQRWLHPTLQTLTHVDQYWKRGLVLGFISETQCNELLQQQPQGTFLLRFSERNAGTITLSHVVQQHKDNDGEEEEMTVEKVTLQISPVLVSAKRADGTTVSFPSLGRALKGLPSLHDW
ncbi:hypothetical protein BASA81_008040 [Batrachochytrium salamandrivorans]|nr:hypothetical protein BASA81_008040 [Batrachochytrium salamandrivorans]